MSFIYKTIFRAENHAFDICQNRWNSVKCSLGALDRKTQDYIPVGSIINKTGKYSITQEAIAKFKPATIKRIELYFQSWNK